MTFAHKLARRLAVLRALPPHCAMLPVLALIVACSAGVPTGVDTGSNPADAPVIVNPRSLVLEANQVSIFKAYAHGVPGDSLVTSIEWTATGGNISLNGTYSSASTGDFKIVGKRHGPTKTTTDTATVTVVQQQPSIVAVVISPGTASVTGGQQQTFSAVGLLSDSTTVAIGVTWTATGGAIDAGGVYTAGSTAGTYRVIAVAASAPVADTVPVTVLSAPPPPQSTGTFPNLPSGYTVPSGYVDNFTQTSGVEGIFSPMYTITIRDASTYSPAGVAAPRNPASSPKMIGEAYYYAGFSSSGIAPGIVWSKDFTSNGWTGLYLSMTVQLSSNWVSHSSGVNKVAFAYIGGGVPMFYASAQDGSNWQMRLQNLQADPKGSARNLTANVASAPVNKGLWQRVEVQLIANTPGQANGIVRAWLTNYDSYGNAVSGPTKIIEYKDVGWVGSSTSPTWNKVSWNPIWGGSGGSNLAVAQYMWMDQFAVGGS